MYWPASTQRRFSSISDAFSAKHDLSSRQDLDVVCGPARAEQPSADVIGERERFVEMRPVAREDDVGIGSGEVSPRRGVSGLEDDRMSLRAAWQRRAER